VSQDLDMDETISIVRLLVYTGPRRWVYATLQKSRIRGTVNVGPTEQPQIIANISECELTSLQPPIKGTHQGEEIHE